MNKKFIVILVTLLFLLQTSAYSEVRRFQSISDNSALICNCNGIKTSHNALQFSVAPFWMIEWVPNDRLCFFSEFPAVGVIFGKLAELDFRQRLVVINLNEHALEYLSGHMRRCIIPGITTFDNMGITFANSQVDMKICAVINGMHHSKRKYDDELTLFFQGPVSKFFPKSCNHASKNIHVGLFSGRGVGAAEKDTIPMERIDEINVSWDEFEALEKSRVAFGDDTTKLKPTSEASSFWTVAIIKRNNDQPKEIKIEEKKEIDETSMSKVKLCNNKPKIDLENTRVIFTYHLVLNSNRLTDEFIKVLSKYRKHYNEGEFIQIFKELKNITRKCDEVSSGIILEWLLNVDRMTQTAAKGSSPLTPENIYDKNKNCSHVNPDYQNDIE
ncbi:hypothetical protein P0136_02985 [Lentisphaerota bacterium ZTH]|nr:hypothetical protein JYG24_05875 [Lentisphaerota bacterium]WET06967.1 hypothetical protein P0136_02985 [Lentisphaerota bacterium ZTH]